MVVDVVFIVLHVHSNGRNNNGHLCFCAPFDVFALLLRAVYCSCRFVVVVVVAVVAVVDVVSGMVVPCAYVCFCSPLSVEFVMCFQCFASWLELSLLVLFLFLFLCVLVVVVVVIVICCCCYLLLLLLLLLFVVVICLLLLLFLFLLICLCLRLRNQIASSAVFGELRFVHDKCQNARRFLQLCSTRVWIPTYDSQEQQP